MKVKVTVYNIHRGAIRSRISTYIKVTPELFRQLLPFSRKSHFRIQNILRSFKLWIRSFVRTISCSLFSSFVWWFFLSFVFLFIRSFTHTLARSIVCRFFRLSFNISVLSAFRSATRSILPPPVRIHVRSSRLIVRSFNQSVSQSVGQSVGQSVI